MNNIFNIDKLPRIDSAKKVTSEMKKQFSNKRFLHSYLFSPICNHTI